MEKKRVYEVAREFHLSSEALLEVLRGRGYSVKGHMSVVTEEMRKAIDSKFEEEKEAQKKELARKKKKMEARRRAERVTVKKERKWRKKTGVKPSEKPKGRVKKDRPQVDQKAVEASVKKTLARMEGREKPKKKYQKRKIKPDGAIEETNVIQVSEFISVAELAEMMEVSPTEVISKCMEMGLLVTINQRLDMDTITMVADEFHFEVEAMAEYGADVFDEEEEEEEALELRAPVVTIMGHVDHGKTKLLDYIRQSNVVATEAGGITQHIGAYDVEVVGGKITFLDTPGHEAFTAMRARGTQVTDVVVLVVAADEAVMPQTIEAIDHARAANVPIVVAVNKIDKPNANAETIRKQLAQQGLLVEEWGGKTIAVDVSAKTGEGVPKLLEMLLLVAQMMEFKTNPNKNAKGVIVEAELDKGKGPVATVLVQEGTLNIGDPFVTGLYSGRVRTLVNARGQTVTKAGPSTPVQVIGIAGVPMAGDTFVVMDSERDARELSLKRQQLKREHIYRPVKRITLDDISQQIQTGKAKDLCLILKGDVDGSVEALSDTLMKLSTDQVKVRVIHQGVGAISPSDILLAVASEAIIIGFHVQPDPRARLLAQQEHIDIRVYNIIYEVVNDVKAAIEGLLEPEMKETIVGTLEVRDIFRASGIGTVAGCFVKSGAVRRNMNVRLLRDSVTIYDGKIASLRRFKEDVREVQTGFECGVGLERFSDIKSDDILEVYEVVETPRELKSNST
ncbi:MAG: translation initiation factor IF-2 [Gemmatimonadota bacterium]|nr:MAG: translation initiation factor IF-2 [Gemmatimonadota bacterium]